MKKNKVRGDSPLKLIIITMLIIFFLALFSWQIEKYLGASKYSTLQSEISSMNLMIEADNLDAFNIYKYAYLHDTNDIIKPLDIKNQKVDFSPIKTLANLFIQNHFTPNGTAKDACYVYIYFPPGEAKTLFDFHEDPAPGFVLAAWSDFKEKPIVAASPGLKVWAEQHLTAGDFYCKSTELAPNKLAVKDDGLLLDLPGIEFQFSGLFYSKAKL